MPEDPVGSDPAAAQAAPLAAVARQTAAAFIDHPEPPAIAVAATGRW